MIRVNDGRVTWEFPDMDALNKELSKGELKLTDKTTIKFTVSIPGSWFSQLVETIKDIGGKII